MYAPILDMELLDVISKIINDGGNETLISPFTLQEVDVVIKTMPSDESPSPNYLSGVLYKFS